MDKKGWLPWYRRKDYKGNLTEEEKRMLDSFRLEKTHPATRYEDLPLEVQIYINRIELELYDKKQEQAAAKAFVLGCVAAIIIVIAYMEQGWYPPFDYAFGAVLLFLAWFLYKTEWNKNAKEFTPKESDAPNQTDEGIQYEWELNWVGRRVRERREKEGRVRER